MPALKATDIRAFIPAKEFELSKRFYRALGWETIDVGPGLALVTVADRQCFYVQDYYLKDFADNSTLHITVESVSDWYAHVVAALESGSFGGARAQPPARQPYGATVVFVHDPAGVLIHLCQWDR